MTQRVTPAGIVQPAGSWLAEEVFWPAWDNLADDARVEWWTLDWLTYAQMGSTTLEDIINSGVVQAALSVAGFHPVYLSRYETGPLADFVVPSLTVRVGDRTFVSPFAGQVVSQGWRNWGTMLLGR